MAKKDAVVKKSVPTMLYKYPGEFICEPIHGLGDFDYVVVDESEIEDYLAKGYYKLPYEAKEAFEAGSDKGWGK